MRIKQLPINTIIPYKNNPRKNNNAIAAVATSLKEFGFRQPIVVDSELVVIVGHTRLLAAQQLKLKKVPVLVATDLTPAQVRAYRLADNRTGENAEWDDDLLAIEISDLDGDIDLSVTGFTQSEIKKLISDETLNDDNNSDTGNQEFENQFMIIIDFDSEDQQTEALGSLSEQGYICRALIS